jgi:hypothetical protein
VKSDPVASAVAAVGVAANGAIAVLAGKPTKTIRIVACE